MKESKKQARLRAKLAEALGLEVPESSGWNERPFAASREAEATLLYIDNKGNGFAHKDCERCNAKFAADSYNVRFCSDQCRKAYAKDIGIEWDPGKPYDRRWQAIARGYQPREYLVVGPNALEQATVVLQEAAAADKAWSPNELIEPVSQCTEACKDDMHTYESGCEFFFLDSTV